MANLVPRVEEDRPTAGIAAERAAATERAAPVPERVVEEVPLLPWSRGLGAEAEVVVRLVDPFGLVAERHRHQQPGARQLARRSGVAGPRDGVVKHGMER